jgi:hypothetical protein
MGPSLVSYVRTHSHQQINGPNDSPQTGHRTLYIRPHSSSAGAHKELVAHTITLKEKINQGKMPEKQ